MEVSLASCSISRWTSRPSAMLREAGSLFRDLHQGDSALAYYRMSLPIARRVRDRGEEQTTLFVVGTLFRDMGLRDSALAYLDQSMAVNAAISRRAGTDFN